MRDLTIAWTLLGAALVACPRPAAKQGPSDSGAPPAQDSGRGFSLPDAGRDAGRGPGDAGSPPPGDAGPGDAGSSDAGPPDSGPPGDAGLEGDAGGPAVYVLIGPDVRATVGQHVVALLQEASAMPVVTEDAGLPADPAPGSLVLSFGDTAAAATLIQPGDLAALGSEGFVVRSGALNGCPLLAEDGNPIAPDPLDQGNLGAQYGAYALLEHLGFAFLHPLRPTLPLQLQPPTQAIDDRQSPRWRIRGWHIHTMHPLELTELLNGFGQGGEDDAAGWASMLPGWSSFLDWALANRQNRVEWVLLEGADWLDFSTSATRQARLQQLVQMGHDQGMAVGIDVPIVLQQQNGFRLITQMTDAGDELAQIHQRIDWLMAAGFDYIGTESGTTEFTAPSTDAMLAWMNEVASYTADTYGKPSYIKEHCATGEVAQGYTDPGPDGGPLNFNFLPYYADPRLGVMPHTVEMYALDDPAPTYGNSNFSDERTILQEEVGQREVIWYPETAYWVTYDINVPLFLPVYAERRLHDLQLLASDEDRGLMGRGPYAGGHMDGQFDFSSGWEWGYWLNDVVTARSSWDPQLSTADAGTSFQTLVTSALAPFGPAAAPIAQVLADTATAQHQLLILGAVDGGAPPSDVAQASGQAYLEGFDTWDDVAHLGVEAGIAGVSMTQPERVGLVDLRNPFYGGPSYTGVIQPLLAQMDSRFNALANRLDALRPQVPANALNLYSDLDDALRITALRAAQMHGLYDYVEDSATFSSGAQGRLTAAEAAQDGGAQVIARRELAYRVNADRIDAWRPNPTAYDYTYLWTVHSQYFWWRDWEKAVNQPASPCYMNIVNPVTVGFGEGIWADAASVVQALGAIPDLTDCLAPPAEEPTYPLP